MLLNNQANQYQCVVQKETSQAKSSTTMLRSRAKFKPPLITNPNNTSSKECKQYEQKRPMTLETSQSEEMNASARTVTSVGFHRCLLSIIIIAILAGFNAFLFNDSSQYMESNDGMSMSMSLPLPLSQGLGSAPSSSSVVKKQEKDKKTVRDSTISYKLIRGLTYNNTYDPFYICKADGYTGERASLSPKFSQNGVLDFHVQITTSLKILIVGDSVGIQFAQALQEATGALSENRHVVYHSWRQHEGVTVASPVRGGGAAAGFRITGLLKEKQKNNQYQLAPVPGGGWMSSNVTSLKEAIADSQMKKRPGHTNVSNNDININAGDLDVIILQFPFGWLEKPALDLFTEDALMDAINTSHKAFGAKTIILQTIPIQNNVMDMKKELHSINNAIYEFAHKYNPPNDGTGVRNVMVMDFAWLSFNLFLHNAVGLKLLPSSTLELLEKRSLSSSSLVAEALNPVSKMKLNCCHKEYPQIYSHVCGEILNEPNNTKYCKMNTYSLDGMHWCMVS